MLRKTVRAEYGETVLVDNNWTAETEKRGATITASTWEWTGGGSLGTQTLVTPKTTTLLAPIGNGVLRNTITLSNGEVLIAVRDVFVSYRRMYATN